MHEMSPGIEPSLERVTVLVELASSFILDIRGTVAHLLLSQ